MISGIKKSALIEMLRSWAEKKQYHMHYADIGLEIKIHIDEVPGKFVIIRCEKVDNIYDTFDVITKDFERQISPVKAMETMTKQLRRRMISKVIFNDPATIVMWDDGTKTVVKCGEGDVYDPEKGMAMAICKKFLGTNTSGSNYCEVFKKWLPEKKEKEKMSVAEGLSRIVPSCKDCKYVNEPTKDYPCNDCFGLHMNSPDRSEPKET